MSTIKLLCWNVEWMNDPAGDTVNRVRRHQRWPGARRQRAAPVRQRHRAADGDHLAAAVLSRQRPLDTLKPKDKEELDFSSIHTTSFKDPIFNGVYQKEWIDHILYSRNQAGVWVTGARSLEDARRHRDLHPVQARVRSLSGFRRRHDVARPIGVHIS
jgi:hypothetical protein